jgi:hypothetical protein
MQFPRDVELRIMKHFDIDTRLKMGILPCKLQVPPSVTEILENVPRPECGTVSLPKCVITWYSSFGMKRLIWMNFERIVVYSVQSKDLEKYTWYIF